MSLSRRGKMVLWMSIVALTALLYLSYRQLEWVETVQDLGFTAEARHNPFLAAEQFLQQRHVPTSAVTGLNDLDTLPPGATLIIAGSRHGLSQQRLRQLWRWVEQGGHLITNAQVFTESEERGQSDPILERLQVSLHAGESSAVKARDRARMLRRRTQFISAPHISSCGDGSNLVAVDVEGETAPLHIAVRPDLALSDDAGAAVAGAGNGDGMQLLQFLSGSGRISLFTDLSLWGSAMIGCHDHAFLLWKLVRGSDAVWFIYNAEMPSLPRLAWEQARTIVVLAMVWLALWLWRNSHRFGPVLTKNAQVRRSLKEHLHAGGMFQWRLGSYQGVLQGLQQAILQAAGRRHPGFNALDAAERSASIAAIAQLDSDQVHWALHCQHCADSQSYTRLIHILQTIRNSL